MVSSDSSLLAVGSTFPFVFGCCDDVVGHRELPLDRDVPLSSLYVPFVCER